ncbi:precorrin-6Y C5,15-methyltransferase (decarboxylating) subunit CbiT [Methanobrevibacter sp. TMH8]|uniref:precorrin-6Y C5,15-methyltransferase (decarboxylating) subunit CbiT n=1 Tax=Methanobrevibacter sp. TMH8 TaxID=2848611 RepID=UPI001CCEBD85|nr:precorrin-6Y C5,15-methyltransferase (decarboxylating) subunit CbiT [Methanobrevibacter sp. TMH8]MBZ9570859.1 precorrin-6Y C5,15-methyltransferase (decarboxylating) subunit CbiT [Methanobrevibacter sp. TMH8]
MIKDSEFITSNEVPGPTKEEIRCLLLCKSEVSSEDIVVDIGCGTGGIATEFAKRAKKVIAIDKNPKAIKLTLENLQKHDVDKKVELIENDGVLAVKSIENIDIAIIGGSGGDLDQILETVSSKLNQNGRIIINAILADTKVQAVNKLKELGYKPNIIEANISKGKIIERGIMMIAENPIAIIYSKL